jgi:predicted house-cleaning noncanonical NTP pyrophosphatase (MazG superfamily)
MNEEMDEICADYTDEELTAILGFLTRTAKAGRFSTERLG